MKTHLLTLSLLPVTLLAKVPGGFDPMPLPPFAPPGLPPPVIRPLNLHANEQPVSVEKTETTVEENAYFRRVKASFTFTNPNARALQAEFEFPLPEGAFVCGYALEVNGEMVPGVVCAKEQARVAFENEVRKGADPGLVEQVKGNIWKTRIFPLNPKTPRKAEVDYICPKPVAAGRGGPRGRRRMTMDEPIYERDGNDIFMAYPADLSPRGRHARPATVGDRIAAFAQGTILWDASLSRAGKVATDRARLERLPATGDWRLVVFSNRPAAPQLFTDRAALLAAVDALVYDGGTDLAAALAVTQRGAPVLLFSDEVDTLAEHPVDLDGDPALVLGSRPDVPARAIEVVKVGPNMRMPRLMPKPSTLLATVWAARRMEDLAAQADTRREEFLALGRRYGVAGPGLSLLVLETLQQWLDHKIEPPAHLAIHDEWVKRRAAEDDPIAIKQAQTLHEAQLLKYWEERVTWWNDPKPPKRTPKSGLFENAAAYDGGMVNGVMHPGTRRAARAEIIASTRASFAAPAVAPAADCAEECCVADDEGSVEAKKLAPGWAGSGTAPSVTLKPWDPKTPYLAALKAAAPGAAYAVYLKERETYRESPAFYLDCAGWFFAAGEEETALRIISNLAEFKLENVALWRTMGWRLREAAVTAASARAREAAVRAFRKALALRGEEGQSYRDLALVLTDRGKADGPAAARRADLEEAARLLVTAAFTNHSRRAARRGNDFQVSIIALEELNGLFAWCAANQEKVGAVKLPTIDAAYRRDLPVKLRIVLGWDADETDIDLHVLEPNGEEAFYGNRRTAEGGFVSEDVTTGYGPEEYLKKDLESGVYRVLTNYFASHQTTLTGATTVQATVYTDWATPAERMQILTLRLDKPKDKVMIGEIRL